MRRDANRERQGACRGLRQGVGRGGLVVVNTATCCCLWQPQHSARLLCGSVWSHSCGSPDYSAPNLSYDCTAETLRTVTRRCVCVCVFSYPSSSSTTSRCLQSVFTQSFCLSYPDILCPPPCSALRPLVTTQVLSPPTAWVTTSPWQCCQTSPTCCMTTSSSALHR